MAKYLTVAESEAIALAVGAKRGDTVYTIRNPEKKAAALALADALKSIERP